jgi:hypothetical protein
MTAPVNGGKEAVEASAKVAKGNVGVVMQRSTGEVPRLRPFASDA